VFTEHGGILRTSEAIRLGIHPRTLYALRDSAEIEPAGRGLYRISTAPPLRPHRRRRVPLAEYERERGL
jgi:hypothetical protein